MVTNCDVYGYLKFGSGGAVTVMIDGGRPCFAEGGTRTG